MTVYFEDIDVGSVHDTGMYTLTKEEIISFAEQFDPQPFHVDEEAAQDSIFGGIIASGLHTLCLSVRLYTDDYFQKGEEMAIMGGLGMDDLRFHEPVYPGDTIRVEIEIPNKVPSQDLDDRGYVDFRVRTYTDDREVMSVVAYGIVERNNESE
jgi:acyl dehydratase